MDTDRLTNSERTRRAMAAKRAAGLAYGPTPFGYRREGGRLVPVPAELALLDAAIRMDSEGASSRAIARMLTASGAMPKRGKAWHHKSVVKMLSSKKLIERKSVEG